MIWIIIPRAEFEPHFAKMEEMDDYDFNDDGLVQAVSNRSNNGSNVDYYEYDYDISESLESFDWKELGPSLFIYRQVKSVFTLLLSLKVCAFIIYYNLSV